MSDTTSTDARTSFAATEPVVVSHFVLWLLVNAGAFVVGHTHLFTTVQWDSFTTGLVPFITAAILGVSATVLRKYVSPWWKKFQTVETKAGFPTLTTEELASFANQLFAQWESGKVAADPVASEPVVSPASSELNQRPAHAGVGF